MLPCLKVVIRVRRCFTIMQAPCASEHCVCARGRSDSRPCQRSMRRRGPPTPAIALLKAGRLWRRGMAVKCHGSGWSSLTTAHAIGRRYACVWPLICPRPARGRLRHDFGSRHRTQLQARIHRGTTASLGIRQWHPVSGVRAPALAVWRHCGFSARRVRKACAGRTPARRLTSKPECGPHDPSDA